MSRFIEVSGSLINVDHIVRAHYTTIDFAEAVVYKIYLSNGHEVHVRDKKSVETIKKLLTNPTNQSTIKSNQGSNHPEKGE